MCRSDMTDSSLLLPARRQQPAQKGCAGVQSTACQSWCLAARGLTAICYSRFQSVMPNVLRLPRCFDVCKFIMPCDSGNWSERWWRVFFKWDGWLRSQVATAAVKTREMQLLFAVVILKTRLNPKRDELPSSDACLWLLVMYWWLHASGWGKDFARKWKVQTCKAISST